MESNYDLYREKKAHGDIMFPFNIYPCVIPDMFPEVFNHWHDEMEIIFIKKGRGIVSVDFDSREVIAPAMVFVLPGQMHAIRQADHSRMEYENIIFHPRFLYQKNGELYDREFLKPLFDGRIQIDTFLTPESSHYQRLCAPLIACDEISEKGKAGFPLFAKGQLFLLCYELYSCFPSNDNIASGKKRLDRVKPALLFIEQHYQEKITVAQAAACTGFSEAHFMRFFKESMGISFVTYLNEYRLSKAEVLLRITDESILYIAQESGFQNFSYFIRSFKAKYGITPLKYREDKNC